MKTLVLCTLMIVLALPGTAAETFKDVPDDHWAAESVQKLADADVVKGYPDGTYKGDRAVTRYELAAALERMIAFIEQSRKPLVPQTAKPQSVAPTNWGQSSIDFLALGGFVPKQSPLLKDGNKPVSFKELSEALVMVSARLVELAAPPADSKHQ